MSSGSSAPVAAELFAEDQRAKARYAAVSASLALRSATSARGGPSSARSSAGVVYPRLVPAFALERLRAGVSTVED